MSVRNSSTTAQRGDAASGVKVNGAAGSPATPHRLLKASDCPVKIVPPKKRPVSTTRIVLLDTLESLTEA
jgi:hypothetical protein